MNFRGKSNTMKILYRDLLHGDLIWIEGYLFIVLTPWSYLDNKRGLEVQHEVVRFTGKAYPDKKYNSYFGTHYDGGTYGARGDIEALIVKREISKPEQYQS